MFKLKINITFLLPALIIIYLLVVWSIMYIGLFTWDDKDFLNSEIITNNDFYKILFSSHYGLYHPLTTVWVKIVYILTGNNPLILHSISIFFHIVNSTLVFVLFRQFNIDKLYALFGFTFFLFHPLNIEPVVWLTSIKDLLSGFFILLSIIFYIKWHKSKAKKEVIAFTLFFALAILSKPQALVLPFVFILIDLFLIGKIDKKTILLKSGLILFSVSILIVSLFIRNAFSNNSFQSNFSSYQDVILVIKAFALYVNDFFWPNSLNVFYPVNYFANSLNLNLWLWLILMVILVVFLFWKKSYKILYLIFIVFIFLSPVIRIIPIGESLVNNRYAYVSIAFFALIIVYVLNKHLFKTSKLIKTIIITTLFGYLVVIFSFFIQRIETWKHGNLDIFSADFKKFPDSEIVANSIGSIYFQQEKLDSAIVYFQKAIAVDSNYFKAYLNMGITYEKLSEPTKAIRFYQKALSINPQFSKSLNQLILLSFDIGNFQECIKYYEKYQNIIDNNSEIYNCVGKSYYSMNFISKAINCFTFSLNIAPENTETLYNLALSHGRIGDYQASVNYLTKAINIEPTFHDAFLLRGLSFTYMNKNGCADFFKAYQLGNKNAKELLDLYCY